MMHEVFLIIRYLWGFLTLRQRSFIIEHYYRGIKRKLHLRNKKIYYQERDWKVIDYKIYYIPPDFENQFRGPEPNLKKEKYIVFIGASQTFGCFCEKPYPTLIGERLNTDILNLGVGGAAPSFFLEHKELWKYINDAKLAVVQVMSGRRTLKSLFMAKNLEQPVVSQALNKNTEIVKEMVSQARTRWIKDYISLFERITVPKVLFWFSKRNPAYEESYDNMRSLLNDFPQLVNEDMLCSVREYADDYVECISGRGLPQKLTNRFTGRPILIIPDLPDEIPYYFNYYYPSPQMQIDAANALEPVCRRYI